MLRYSEASRPCERSRPFAVLRVTGVRLFPYNFLDNAVRLPYEDELRRVVEAVAMGNGPKCAKLIAANGSSRSGRGNYPSSAFAEGVFSLNPRHASEIEVELPKI